MMNILIDYWTGTAVIVALMLDQCYMLICNLIVASVLLRTSCDINMLLKQLWSSCVPYQCTVCLHCQQVSMSIDTRTVVTQLLHGGL